MLEAELIDELVLFMAPKLMGHRSKSLMDLPVFETMSQVPELTITELKQIGKDICLTAKLQRS
jgi:diaminohydroxyphosphoribosylaminopyrimidine deaminase/5-amino-6-(5-phosphoribosylamino)uracil reductase